MDDEDRNIIMADMEGAYQSTQPATIPNLQQTVNMYFTLMIQIILTDPWISTPQVLNTLVEMGWTGSRHHILRCFGGWQTFSQTIARMEQIRAGAINGRMRGLPVTTSAPPEGQLGRQIPEPDGFIAWWAPQPERAGPPFLFRIAHAGMGELHRYPHSGVYATENSEDDITDPENRPENMKTSLCATPAGQVLYYRRRQQNTNVRPVKKRYACVFPSYPFLPFCFSPSHTRANHLRVRRNLRMEWTHRQHYKINKIETPLPLLSGNCKKQALESNLWM